MSASLRAVGFVAATVALLYSGVSGSANAAGPDLQPLVDTKCDYAQVIAGINELDPGLGQEIAGFPPAADRLQQFLSLPIDQRQQFLNQELSAHPLAQEILDAVEGDRGGQEDIGILTQVSQSCNRYPAAPPPNPA